MKKTLYIIAFAIFLVVSCQKNEISDEGIGGKPADYKTLTVGIDDQQATRVGFDDLKAFYWHKGDRIGVITSAGLKVMDLYDEYDKKPVGVFYGNFQEEYGDYVIYPYGNHRIENGVMTYVLPSSYVYTSIEDDAHSFNPPMLGMINGNSYREKSEIIIGGVTLPFGITECTEGVYEETEKTLSPEQRKSLSYLRFTDLCATEFRYLEVEKSEIKSDENGGFSGSFDCVENIGKEHPMQIEQTETADP